jgi:hypothetical protein
MRRRNKYSEEPRTLCVKISQRQFRELENYCDEHRVSWSDAVRSLLSQGLEKDTQAKVSNHSVRELEVA